MKSRSEKLSMDQVITLIIIGLVGGMLSGLVGLGGGVVVVPALVIVMGFPQHLAQGTTLAMMVPPIGILAVISYYNKGHVDLRIAAILCIGFVIGGFFGSKIALSLKPDVLKKVFGVVLVAIAAKLLFMK